MSVKRADRMNIPVEPAGTDAAAPARDAGTFLFVDYENVGKVDLSVIPQDVRVFFFLGASQKSIPTGLFDTALKLGSRFVKIDIEGQGRNALDFHISFYLGKHLAANPRSNCIILSKDKNGFDVLVRHLTTQGFKVRRADSIAQAFPDDPASKVELKPSNLPTNGDTGKRTPLLVAIDWLTSMQARARPRKRKGLVAHLHTRFGKRIPEHEVEQIVASMIAQKNLSETGGKLAYHL